MAIKPLTCRFPDDFIVLAQLGKGSFGYVNLVKYRRDNNIYALKIHRTTTHARVSHTPEGCPQCADRRHALPRPGLCGRAAVRFCTTVCYCCGCCGYGNSCLHCIQGRRRCQNNAKTGVHVPVCVPARVFVV